jgi:hypothetical protein
MDLQNLPENVLFKICRYADDYKWNLLLTSKYFNDFIGRNQKLCKFSRLFFYQVEFFVDSFLFYGSC